MQIDVFDPLARKTHLDVHGRKSILFVDDHQNLYIDQAKEIVVL